MSKGQKRTDIQLLRAISVLIVIFYHAGIDSFKNGFLGVDIFFVISGYLMAHLYSQSSTRSFLRARIRRLAPSFGLVSIVITVFCFAVVTPFEFKEIAREVILGIAGISNLYFWNDDTYFASGQFRPLLHLWTLAIELQFYLLFPSISKLARYRKWIWVIVFFSSLVLSQVILFLSPKTSFFLLPTRLWEFVLGVVASGLSYKMVRVEKRFRRSIAIFSTLGIATSLYLEIDSDSRIGLTGHPGLATVLIAFSTAALLSVNYSSAYFESRVARVLVGIGSSSYAIYLIHYPLFVAINYSPFESSETHLNGSWSKVLGIALSISLGIALTKFYEKPILDSNFSTKWLYIGAIGLSGLSLLMIPLNNASSQGEARKISQSLEDRATYRCGKIFRILNPTSITCQLNETKKPGAQNILLLGNSHADAIKIEMEKLSRSEEFNLFFWVDNNPFTGSSRQLLEIANEIKKLKISNVVLHSSFNYPHKWEIERLLKLTESQSTKFYMIESIPTYLESVPILEYRKSQGLAVDFAKYVNPESFTFSQSFDLIKSVRFKYISSHYIFCEKVCSWSSPDGHLYYFDSNHLTLTGARLLGEVLRKLNFAPLIS